VNDAGSASSFEVGVAIVTTDDGTARPSDLDDEMPGYEDASGRRMRRRHAEDLPTPVVVKGADAVQAATEAIAGQVALAADRIAAAIQARSVAKPEPGDLGLESVQVSFGITLTAGIQALFTAQAESSAQVTISLVRRPEAPC
jgi:hypothetical protein